MTTPACSTIVGTPESSRISPDLVRERRCGDSSPRRRGAARRGTRSGRTPCSRAEAATLRAIAQLGRLEVVLARPSSARGSRRPRCPPSRGRRPPGRRGRPRRPRRMPPTARRAGDRRGARARARRARPRGAAARAGRRCSRSRRSRARARVPRPGPGGWVRPVRSLDDSCRSRVPAGAAPVNRPHVAGRRRAARRRAPPTVITDPAAARHDHAALLRDAVVERVGDQSAALVGCPAASAHRLLQALRVPDRLGLGERADAAERRRRGIRARLGPEHALQRVGRVDLERDPVEVARADEVDRVDVGVAREPRRDLGGRAR